MLMAGLIGIASYLVLSVASCILMSDTTATIIARRHAHVGDEIAMMRKQAVAIFAVVAVLLHTISASLADGKQPANILLAWTTRHDEIMKHYSSRTAVVRTRTPGGVTGKARESLPMSIAICPSMRRTFLARATSERSNPTSGRLLMMHSGRSAYRPTSPIRAGVTRP